MPNNPDQTALAEEASITRSFVRDDGNATIVCPQCNCVKIVPVGKYKGRQHKLKVRCPCSHLFIIHLDFRQYYRKSTNFSGIYGLHPPAVGGGSVQILNISQNGLCFEVDDTHPIRLEQKGRIDFTLDDKKKTRLVREFVVKGITGNLIGCEFRKTSQYEKELGFYLRFGP